MSNCRAARPIVSVADEGGREQLFPFRGQPCFGQFLIDASLGTVAQNAEQLRLLRPQYLL